MQRYDYSELGAVDTAFGHYLAECLASVNPAFRTGELAEFFARESGQIFRGEYETPAEVLRNIAGEKAQAITLPGGAIRNAPNPPVVAYYREPAFGNAEMVGQGVRPVQVSNEAGGFAELRLLPVTLTYRVGFIGFRKPVCDHLALTWYHWRIYRPKFVIPFAVEGLPTDEIYGTIREKGTFEVEDISEKGADGGGIRGLQNVTVVETNIVYGTEIFLGDTVDISTNFTGYCVRA